MAKASTGYWILASDGAVLPEGGAPDFRPPVGPLTVSIAATHDEGGYWLLDANGTVTPEGDAAVPANGNASGTNSPVVAIAGGPTDSSYWVLLADGTVLGFGTPSLGYANGLPTPAIGIAVNATQTGYAVCDEDGACGSFGANPPSGDFWTSSANNPLVAITATGNTSGTIGMWGLHADNTTSSVDGAANAGNVSDHNTPMVDLVAHPAMPMTIGSSASTVRLSPGGPPTRLTVTPSLGRPTPKVWRA